MVAQASRLRLLLFDIRLSRGGSTL